MTYFQPSFTDKIKIFKNFCFVIKKINYNKSGLFPALNTIRVNNIETRVFRNILFQELSIDVCG